MAIAERHARRRVRRRYRRPPYLVIAADGCLMEGISQEAISLAGPSQAQQADRLFDDNGITIDGALSLADCDRPTEALRGRGLDRIADRRARSGGDRCGAREGADLRQARADRLQDQNRIRRADQAGIGKVARVAARRRGNRRRAQDARLDFRAIRSAGRHPEGLARSAGAFRRRARRLGKAAGRARRRQACANSSVA